MKSRMITSQLKCKFVKEIGERGGPKSIDALPTNCISLVDFNVAGVSFFLGVGRDLVSVPFEMEGIYS